MGTTATTILDSDVDIEPAASAGGGLSQDEARALSKGDKVDAALNKDAASDTGPQEACVFQIDSSAKSDADTATKLPFASARRFDASRYRWEGKIHNQRCKRVFDIVASATALVALAPLLLVIALLIRISDGGPALFAHMRITAHGRPFKCLKFRTMVVGAEARLADLLQSDPTAAEEWARCRKLTNDPRQTRLGPFLRRSSLDELPQLWNILVGEMSFVGPRPIVPCELEMYGLDAIHYLRLRPGLTGPWQVNGRSDTSYEARVLADRNYSLKRTFFGDVALVLMTIPAVLLRQGAR